LKQGKCHNQKLSADFPTKPCAAGINSNGDEQMGTRLMNVSECIPMIGDIVRAAVRDALSEFKITTPSIEPAEQCKPPRNYTVPEFVQEFKISRTSVYALIKSGELKSIRVGGKRLIPFSSAVELFNPASK
jgi:excisionase family DNA binding protein